MRAVSFLLSLVDPPLLAMPRTRTKRRSRFAVPHRNPYQKLSKEEIRLAGMWHKEDGMDSSEIAQLLRRDKSTMTRLLVKLRLKSTVGQGRVELSVLRLKSDSRIRFSMT